MWVKVERDGRSRDDLHLIAVGQLIGNRGGEDGAPHIVNEAIIQYVKSAQHPTFRRWTLGDLNDGRRAQSSSMSAATAATDSQVTILQPVVGFSRATDC